MATLTFTLPFPDPVHCGRGWWGHSGRTDHASGPEKQHGRRVSQGREPGEQPELEGWWGVRGCTGGGQTSDRATIWAYEEKHLSAPTGRGGRQAGGNVASPCSDS